MAHGDHDPKQVSFFVLTISDTRTRETDESGRTIIERIEGEGHKLVGYDIEKDDSARIREILERVIDKIRPDVIVANGGTGISARDTSIEAIEGLIEKRLPGFGEIFRALSFAEIGPKALLSRMTAGVCGRTILFLLPGSTSAVKLGLDRLIFPVVFHAVGELRRQR